MEAFLTGILPKIIGDHATFSIHAHQGKSDLLRKLAGRLRAYAKWLPQTWRIVVLVDRDDADCKTLKRQLEKDAAAAGLRTPSGRLNSAWRVVNRIAIEELEAWYFGEWKGVCCAYPKSEPSIVTKAAHRNCDAILGGTWEALERALQRKGYFVEALRKIEIAQKIGDHFDHGSCVSPSFIKFKLALTEVIIDQD